MSTPIFFYDEERSRYVIRNDKLEIFNPDSIYAYVSMKLLFNIMQDNVVAWGRLKEFTEARSNSVLFEIAHNKNGMTKHADFVTELNTRFAIDSVNRIVYFYAKDKKPSSYAETTKYYGPSVYTPVTQYESRNEAHLYPLGSVSVEHPTNQLLDAVVTASVGSFKLGTQLVSQLTFRGDAKRLTEELRRVEFVAAEDTANIIIEVDDGMNVLGAVGTGSVHVSGRHEVVMPHLTFIPSKISFGNSYNVLSVSDCIKYTGSDDDIVEIKISTTHDSTVRFAPSGSRSISLDNTSGEIVVDTTTYGKDLNNASISCYRANFNGVESKFNIAVKLSEDFENAVVTAELDIEAVANPEPNIAWLIDEIVIPADKDEVTIHGAEVLNINGLTDGLIVLLYVVTGANNIKSYRLTDTGVETYVRMMDANKTYSFMGSEDDQMLGYYTFFRSSDEAVESEFSFDIGYNDGRHTFPIKVRQEAKVQP